MAETVYIRRDVWRLSDEDTWHPIILNYARAVAQLRTLDTGNFADPRSWRHLAAIHGTVIPRSERPPHANWDQCEHFGWYFLPWHRAYLHHFEKIVRATVSSIGGPEDWTLPYWDYSDHARQGARRLPPAFRQAMLPDGTPNALFARDRDPAMNGGGELTETMVNTRNALEQTEFTDPDGQGVIPSFGGELSLRLGGHVAGALENAPHGLVHTGVGGRNGWMSRFETAAIDPIFWLHHANIDRLWAQWLRTPGNPGGLPTNPRDRRWLGEHFRFGSGRWATDLTSEETVDTRATPLSYSYDDEPAQRRQTTPPTGPGDGGLEAVVRRGPPEMIGATARETSLTNGPSHAEIEVAEPRGAGLESFAGARQPQRLYLQVENIHGKELPASSFDVYVNAPEAATKKDLANHLAGTISMFGVLESSQRNETHGGEGLTVSFDITDLVRRLQAARDWNPKKLRVTFAPIADSAGKVYGGALKVGRISLHKG